MQEAVSAGTAAAIQCACANLLGSAILTPRSPLRATKRTPLDGRYGRKPDLRRPDLKVRCPLNSVLVGPAARTN